MKLLIGVIVVALILLIALTFRKYKEQFSWGWPFGRRTATRTPAPAICPTCPEPVICPLCPTCPEPKPCPVCLEPKPCPACPTCGEGDQPDKQLVDLYLSRCEYILQELNKVTPKTHPNECSETSYDKAFLVSLNKYLALHQKSQVVSPKSLTESNTSENLLNATRAQLLNVRESDILTVYPNIMTIPGNWGTYSNMCVVGGRLPAWQPNSPPMTKEEFFA